MSDFFTLVGCGVCTVACFGSFGAAVYAAARMKGNTPVDGHVTKAGHAVKGWIDKLIK